MLTLPIEYYLILSAIVFLIGTIGVLTRRNAIIIFMCVELMLNSVNLTLVAFSQYLGDMAGQILVLLVMTVAAAEAAVGLAIVLALFRNKETVYIDEVNLLKW
jgi:NADH-quinone oxidoreductase subunit K